MLRTFRFIEFKSLAPAKTQAEVSRLLFYDRNGKFDPTPSIYRVDSGVPALQLCAEYMVAAPKFPDDTGMVDLEPWVGGFKFDMYASDPKNTSFTLIRNTHGDLLLNNVEGGNTVAERCFRDSKKTDREINYKKNVLKEYISEQYRSGSAEWLHAMNRDHATIKTLKDRLLT